MLVLRDKLGLVPVRSHPEWHTLIFKCLVEYKGGTSPAQQSQRHFAVSPFQPTFQPITLEIALGMGQPTSTYKRDKVVVRVLGKP
jgi:hypothetical protein